MPSHPLLEPDSPRWILSADGTLHPYVHRLHLETRHNTDHYTIPNDVGIIVHVRLVSGVYRPFVFLEAPHLASYFHLFANGSTPIDLPSARDYLRHAHDKIRRPLWYRLGNSLVLHPAPVNSGELLLIDYESIQID